MSDTGRLVAPRQIAAPAGGTRRGRGAPGTHIASHAGLPVLAAMLLAVVVLAISLGPVVIPFGDTVRILLGAHDVPDSSALVVESIRLPRVLLSVLAGCGLGVAGAVMQAFFRNPLADPGVTGISSGAAVGAVAVLATGADLFGRWTLPLAAFAGALAVMGLTQLIGAVARDRTPVTLLLVGIALNAFFGAVVGAIIANAPDSQTVRGAVFWLQGDLTAASWDDVRLVVAPVLVCATLAMLTSRELNALLLGDETARSIGVNVGLTRGFLLVITAVLVGSIVAVTGVIGFVGLVVPHLVRLVLGADHRLLLPASALLGAAFLTAADTVARVVTRPVSWQTGVVTALVGSPVFLLLVLRIRRAGRSS